MKPHSCVGVCGGSIFVFEGGLHVGDCAIRTRFCDVGELEVGHVVSWDGEGTILDFDSFGVEIVEELRLEVGDVWIV